jgi:hypothetical protein
MFDIHPTEANTMKKDKKRKFPESLESALFRHMMTADPTWPDVHQLHTTLNDVGKPVQYVVASNEAWIDVDVLTGPCGWFLPSADRLRGICDGGIREFKTNYGFRFLLSISWLIADGLANQPKKIQAYMSQSLRKVREVRPWD